MIVSSGIATSIIAVQFVAGCFAGLFVAWLLCRRALTRKIAAYTAFATALGLELAVGVMGWASYHQSSWGADLISSHPLLLIPTSTIAISLVAALVSRRYAVNESHKGST